MLDSFIKKISRGCDLSESEAQECLDKMLSGECQEESIIQLLDSLCQKGESISEITGFAKTLLSKKVPVQLNGSPIDLCGTGGSGLERFNVSTAVAFVLASGGYPVAKHGNKGSKKANGSFDLLEKLGIDINTTPELAAELFQTTSLCFLFARAHHPDMKHVGPARAKLGRRSIFNLIGPLCNPADIQYQIMGISDPKLGPTISEVLKQLERKKALVVYGEPGIDEFSISGPSTYWLVENGQISEHSLVPNDLGIAEVPYERLPHGDCDLNVEIFHKLINGHDCEGLSDMVALNAGAAIYTLEQTDSIQEGYSHAKELLNTRKTKQFFENYPKASSI